MAGNVGSLAIVTSCLLLLELAFATNSHGAPCSTASHRLPSTACQSGICPGQLSTRLRGGLQISSKMSENQFTYKDQLMLNQYAGLKKEVEDLQQELKKDHEDLESLRDALDELEIYKCKAPPEFDKIRNLPPPLQFRWGETFSTWDPQTVGDILESQLNGLETMVGWKSRRKIRRSCDLLKY
ncbi:hypothetical protein GUITHDRAFT_162783 [Guillardia theta CCMP2712]|uniref:Uncharacterized protein n=1 Tax=Guillardia theta (strain CCMP2712) TaxID=905079 RepID=L1JG82_GUITC|nr:hypothetical protein GUITHDRAFT_162783 [Guillardia theta CCMP2712]EKX47154.1 hypothetical protein GUITHDRAFT_162783 [Guillardia theta CCMP2712]|eukprot:XP_005834134.1 hypothetical protein GUITHDRAFT_162783 [Guillardia theta CCMP2712]